MADTINFIAAAISNGSGNSKITALRVQDISLQKWFNWDNGSWDANGKPTVSPGANNLYISVWAINNGTASTIINLSLLDGATTLKTVSNTVNPNQGIGLEYTGSMPTTQLNLTAKTDKDSVPLTIYTPTAPPPPPEQNWLLIVTALGIGIVTVGGGAYLYSKRKKSTKRS